IDLPALHEDEDTERGHRLAYREDVDERIALPRPRASGVHPPGPDVDHGLAFDRDRNRCAKLPSVAKVFRECVPHGGEALVPGAEDLRDVGHPLPRETCGDYSCNRNASNASARPSKVSMRTILPSRTVITSA